ncbi:MAG: hypothetical protein ACJ8FS_03350 [Sphingomicrobium sp.]
MRHSLIDPAFPDMVGEWATEAIHRKARVWTVTRGEDGRLEERLDPGFLAQIDEHRSIDDIVDALLTAAAEQDVAESRIW